MGPRLLIVFTLVLVVSAWGCSEVHNAVTSTDVRPVSTGSGAISEDTIHNYQNVAVIKFADAPGAPNSGSVITGLVSNWFTEFDFTVVERTRLDQILDEQKLQLIHSDEKMKTLAIGKLVGAKAVVLGEIGQWNTTVSLSLRMVDAETGAVLFNGEGAFSSPHRSSPEIVARHVIKSILNKLAVKTGLRGGGRIGYRLEFQKRRGALVPVVASVIPGSPAEIAGLQVGDEIQSCNGGSGWETTRQFRKQCQAQPGEPISMEVRRAERQISINAKAIHYDSR